MTSEQKALVDVDLVKAILTFHEVDDKEEREKYVREYFFSFCRKNNIIEAEAIERIEMALAEKRKNSIFKFEHYTNLREILYPRKVDLESEGR